MDEFTEKLARCEQIITYQPILGEPDWKTLPLPEALRESAHVLAHNSNADPFEVAESCARQFSGMRVGILIPGQQFDCSGTRHGRGGGWYDRFLSRAPVEWLRIGIANQDHVSENPLRRESWDEPVDFLFVRTPDGFSAHETNARRIPENNPS